jgi:hypothetical protein
MRQDHRRHDAAAQRSWTRTLEGAGLIAAHLLAPWRRSWRTRWGAHPSELHHDLAGNDLIPEPTWTYTHAISIDAPASQVWPWIAQLGQEHGGFASYERLENLIGCRIRNADTIVEAWQHPRVGDTVRLHPKAPPLHVAAVDPGRSLVLHGAAAVVAPPATASCDPTAPTAATGPDNLWSFHLFDDGPHRCRLVEHGRTIHGRKLSERLFFGTTLIEPIGFVMSREMLRAIRFRAEHGWVQGRDDEHDTSRVRATTSPTSPTTPASPTSP